MALDLRSEAISTRPRPRVITEIKWASVLKIGGSDADTSLYYPAFLQSDSTGVYVYDLGQYRIIRTSRTGEVEWAYGHKGKGPDEFENVRDLELDSEGRLWILDPENARITVLNRRGDVEARLPLRDLPYTEQVIPLPTGEALVLTLQPERPLIRVDRDGSARSGPEIPWPMFRSLHPLASQLTAAVDSRRDEFALAFRVGNGFFVFRRGVALPYYGSFVEHTDFPAVDEMVSGGSRTARLSRPMFSAYAIALTNGLLFVLFSGHTEQRNALVDIYEVETGRYVRSLLLPRRLTAISVAAGLIYGVYEDPYPGLESWRPDDPSVLER